MTARKENLLALVAVALGLAAAGEWRTTEGRDYALMSVWATDSTPHVTIRCDKLCLTREDGTTNRCRDRSQDQIYAGLPRIHSVALSMTVDWKGDSGESFAFDVPPESIQPGAGRWYRSDGAHQGSAFSQLEGMNVGAVFPTTGFRVAWEEFQRHCTSL